MPGALLFYDLLLNFNPPSAFAHSTEATIHRHAVQRSHEATLAPLTGTLSTLFTRITSPLTLDQNSERAKKPKQVSRRSIFLFPQSVYDCGAISSQPLPRQTHPLQVPCCRCPLPPHPPPSPSSGPCASTRVDPNSSSGLLISNFGVLFCLGLGSWGSVGWEDLLRKENAVDVGQDAAAGNCYRPDYVYIYVYEYIYIYIYIWLQT